MTWQLAPLGDVLRLRAPDTSVDPTTAYQFAGVYSFGRGVFRGVERKGNEFSYRTLTRLREGQFVYPKLMAWEGAFGVVPAACSGCYVSPEFPVFEVNAHLLLPRFLDLYFRIPGVWESVSGGSAGTNVRRRRLHPKGLLRLQMPLPTLSEQQRVVDTVDGIAGKIQVARNLRLQTDQETTSIIVAEEMAVWPDESLAASVRTLDDVTTFLARGRQTRQGPSNHYLIKTQHVQMGRYVNSTITLSPEAAAKVNDAALAQSGDILIACSAAGCLGRVALYSDGTHMSSTDSHVAIARANPNLICPKYLYAYLRGAQGQVQLRSREKGDWKREKVGFRLTELNVADLRKVPVPVPSPAEQQRIVDYIEAVRAKVDGLKTMQSKVAAELDALLPAVLDRAFRGEL